jgi:hypothetical protein
LIGFVMGGRETAVRSVFALGTAQRNVAVAVCVGGFHRLAPDFDPNGEVDGREKSDMWWVKNLKNHVSID